MSMHRGLPTVLLMTIAQSISLLSADQHPEQRQWFEETVSCYLGTDLPSIIVRNHDLQR